MKSPLRAAASSVALLLSFGASAFAQEAVETVTVTAKRLADARNAIQPQTGASTYTITAADIATQPGGENALLSDVLLRAPGVAQDSFGQFHVRGEHAGLQYRLNGIALPEGISAFGQTLDPRLADSMRLITGALPAQYGLHTAGIIDIQAKTGLFDPGGHLTVYGGSHSEVMTSADYGGSSGNLSYFVSGDYRTSLLGLESPDGSSTPLHDRTKQYHGFAFVQDILDAKSSLTAILGTSNSMFEIPNRRGLQPSGLDGVIGFGAADPGSGNNVLQANGQSAFPSALLDERQREITHYAALSYLRSDGPLDFQLSVFARYSSLFFTPDQTGDLLYNGISQTAYKRDVAYGSQLDSAWHAGDHTIRFGALFQIDDTQSRTTSLVLPTDVVAPANPNCPVPNPDGLACQTSGTPQSIIDNASKQAWNYSLYLQDEWKLTDALVFNYGLRWDQYDAYAKESQLSPRASFVWTADDDTTVHIGYARYFSPPPIELIANATVSLFANTTAAPPQSGSNTPKAERADYYDIGLDHVLLPGLTLGVDAFYKASRNLLDEGQFGAPIILTPFNYQSGRQYGLEFTASYTRDDFSAYANLGYSRAAGKNIVSSEFQFDPSDLAYIAANYIPLDHQQIMSFSTGAQYRWDYLQFSADLLYGSGLRRDGATPNGDHLPDYVQVNLGLVADLAVIGLDDLSARIDVINLFDEKYAIRDGTGVGVGAPQFGPRRGFFFGVTKTLN